MYIAPGQGADNALGTNVDVNRKPLSLCPFVVSFKTVSLKYDFKHILNDFVHVYSLRAGTETPWGQNFDVNRKPLSLCPFVASLKKNLIWYIFLMILYMYIAPGQGQTTPWWQTFDVNRKPLSLCPFVAGFKKLPWSPILYTLFSCFTICI